MLHAHTSTRRNSAPSIQLYDDSQLDTILPFLQSLPHDIHLGICYAGSNATLYAQWAMPDKNVQTEVRRHLLSVVSRTIKHAHLVRSRDSLQKCLEDGFKNMPCALQAGPALATLVPIGETIVRTATRGKFYIPENAPPKTPTECLAALLDGLDADQASKSGHAALQGHQRIKKAEMLRSKCMMEIQDVRSLLQELELEIDGQDNLPLGARIHALLEELNEHGAAGPHKTRLHDNVYGRIWETALNEALMEDIPPQVLCTANILRRSFLDMALEIPDAQSRSFREDFLRRVQSESPRPWSYGDPRLKELSAVEELSADLFEKFLQLPTSNGYEALGDFFVGKILFDVLKDLMPDFFHWRVEAGRRYKADIMPLKGKTKFDDLSVECTPGIGITLSHHSPLRENAPNMRAVLVHTWDLDTNSTLNDMASSNMLALRRGVPVGTGISGYTHLFTSFFLYIRDATKLDLAHAVLGLLVYLVVQGGHTWNEGLVTLHYLERKLGMGLLHDASETLRFVADYVEFVRLFDGCETKDYIDRAIERANRETLAYRRRMLR